jgi:hypothetical protein
MILFWEKSASSAASPRLFVETATGLDFQPMGDYSNASSVPRRSTFAV